MTAALLVMLGLSVIINLFLDWKLRDRDRVVEAAIKNAARLDILVAAMRSIRNRKGGWCVDGLGLCGHAGCASSHSATVIATNALEAVDGTDYRSR